MKRLALLLSLALAAAIAAPSAFAACGLAISFSQGGYACGGYYCYINSPGDNQIGTLGADFWSLNTGNPAAAAGDDDGTWANDGWLTRYGPAYGIYMIATSNWAGSPLIDGCIENKLPVGHSNEVMVAAFSDQGGGQGFWAVSATERDRANSPQFNFSGGGNDINLVAIPTPAIVASRRIDANNIEVDIACPDLCAAGAFYSDGTTSCTEVVQGCQIFNQQLGVGAVGPNDRAVGSGWVNTGTMIANGATGTVPINCAGDSSNYLGIGVAFDSGFTSQFVGGNSNRVDCGPNSADPSPRFKIIDRKDNSLRPKDK